VDHALEAAIGGSEGAPLTLRIEARTPDSKGLLHTNHLNFYFRARDVPAKLVESVSVAAARELEDWTVERIAALVAEDPESGRPGLAMPPAVDEQQRPRSLLDTWGASDAYADFFAGGEIARAQLDSVFPSVLFRFVQHCDPECLQVNPHTVIPTVTQINFPWDDRHRRPFGPVPRKPGDDDTDNSEGMITTELTEEDVILGSPGRVREVLSHAVNRPDPQQRPIFFSNTCVPAVIGEDVQSIVRQVEQESGKQIFYLTVSPRSMTTVFQELLVNRRLAAERLAPPPAPDAVNLIGYPSSQAVAELEQLLALAGVKVNVKLLPDILPTLIEHLPGGALNVVYPNRTWQHLLDQVTSESRIPSLTLTAPFGWERSREWLHRIADRMGTHADLESAWSCYVEPWRARWEEFGRAAREHRVGIVVRDEEDYFLTTPAATWGVPLVGVLEEMGFGIDLLIRVSNPKTANENARALRATFRHPERHSIRAFDSFAFLRHRLRESRADAFLSYQFFDWRLSEAGKAAFSIQHFEMGVPGAVRTLERLLGVCQTPFYRRYSRWLARTPEGLRMLDGAPEQAGGIA
jgi:hypothetical protein